jgi:hypothetical protein
MNQGTYGDTNLNPLAGYTYGLHENYINNKWVFHDPRPIEPIGFALQSGLEFDSTIQSPFLGAATDSRFIVVPGAFVIEPSGYTNNLITSANSVGQFNMAVNPNQTYPVLDARPVLTSDGDYEGGYVQYAQLAGTPPGGIPAVERGSSLYLEHLLIDALPPGVTVGYDWVKTQNQGPLMIPTEPMSDGFTIEVIVKLASVINGTGTTGITTVTWTLAGDSKAVVDRVLIEGVSNALTYISLVFGAQYLDGELLVPGGDQVPEYNTSNAYQHIALEVDNGVERIYVNGKLIRESGGGIDSFCYPFYTQLRIDDTSSVVDGSDYPGKSRLKAWRFTTSALYKGNDFTPPTNLLNLDRAPFLERLAIK